MERIIGATFKLFVENVIQLKVQSRLKFLDGVRGKSSLRND
jgi:hypothetical protein